MLTAPAGYLWSATSQHSAVTSGPISPRKTGRRLVRRCVRGLQYCGDPGDPVYGAHGNCRDAFIAGALAGPIAMIPAFIFFLTMIATYPDVLDAAVPADFMMARLDLPLVSGLFYVAVFGTFVQTGTGFVHAVNERIAEVIHEHNREMPRWLRPLVALLALIFSVSLASRFGLVDLIAGGYGTLTWVFIAVFLLPLLTVGLHRIFQGA